MKAWVYDPHSGGNKIPATQHPILNIEVQDWAKMRPWYPDSEFFLKFRGTFCYVSTKKQNEAQVWPLARLRYVGKDRWSVAIFLYSNETYEPHGLSTYPFTEALSACEFFMVS